MIYERTLNLKTVGKVIGDSSLKMVMRYIKVKADEQIDDAINGEYGEEKKTIYTPQVLLEAQGWHRVDKYVLSSAIK